MLFSYRYLTTDFPYMQAEKAGISPLFRIFREVPSFSYPISTRTAAAEVRNITASAQSEAGMV